MRRGVGLVLVLSACHRVPPAPPPIAWTDAERCRLVRSVLHLESAQGHDVEWFADNCSRWPAPVDVSLGDAGTSFFQSPPDCSDGEFAVVNERGSARHRRGLRLALDPLDGGFAFFIESGPLNPRPGDSWESLCGTISGEVVRADGGWLAWTRPEP